MSPTRIITGNIFTTSCQTLVNTVNTVGVMGAGIALECRLRYPEMFDRYVQLCEAQQIDIGTLWIYKTPDRWILNFPTKRHWRHPTKEHYIREGLEKFMDTYEAKGIESVAFPLLGAQHGGLDPERSLELMQSYLERCTIRVEIYKYDRSASDELYDAFRTLFMSMSEAELKQMTGLRRNYIRLIHDAMQEESVRQLNQLALVEGIGVGTLEKAFAFARQAVVLNEVSIQQKLDL